MVKLGTKVVVGIPTLSSSRRSTAWTDALSGLEFPLGSASGRIWRLDERIDLARNALCEQALEIGADYLFFLGDDVLAPSRTILSMLEKIDRRFTVAGREIQADLITGVYWTKGYPTSPYLWNGLLQGPYGDWTAGEFFPVDFAGCDCLMIPTRVLREIPRPWFSLDWTWNRGDRPPALNTEDFYFYTKARKAGFRLFADTAIQCYHEDRTTGTLFALTTEMSQAGGVPATPDGEDLLVAELGAGLAAPSYGDRTRVVRFDLRESVKPDVRCDVAHLPEQHHGIYDLVNASHLIEHFPRAQAPALIREWARLLKLGGELRVWVPNLEVAFRRILEGTHTNYDWSMIYGDQAEEGAPWEHRNGFTRRKLEMLLRSHPGLGEIRVEDDPHPGCDHNLVGYARLLRADEPESLVEMWEEIERAEGSHG